MKDNIKEYILKKNMIAPGDRVWVALSGGADSCCLLHILSKLSDEMNFHLNAVHVNHMLRGRESDSDEAFCKKLCSDLGIDLSVFKKDIRKFAEDEKMTIEEAGRKARYEIFAGHCDGKVALGHNLNDNAETLIMNLLRGSGLEGLGGISETNGKYLRPLLKTARGRIEKYCDDNKLEYIDDISNKDTVYFRNAVRLRAIPLLNDISGKDVTPIIARTAEILRKENSFIIKAVEEAFRKTVVLNHERAEIDNDGICAMHPVIAARVVRKAVEYVKGNLKDIEQKNTDILMDIIKKNKTGEATDLAGEIHALVQFGKTLIYKKEETAGYDYTLPIPGEIYIKEINATIRTEISDMAGEPNEEGNIHYFSVDSCADGFHIRNRRNGDIIKPWKGSGTVKLKKYLIANKVFRMDRDKLLLIICKNSVVYIDGMTYGKDFIPCEGDKIVKVKIERG